MTQCCGSVWRGGGHQPAACVIQLCTYFLLCHQQPVIKPDHQHALSRCRTVALPHCCYFRWTLKFIFGCDQWQELDLSPHCCCSLRKQNSASRAHNWCQLPKRWSDLAVTPPGRPPSLFTDSAAPPQFHDFTPFVPNYWAVNKFVYWEKPFPSGWRRWTGDSSLSRQSTKCSEPPSTLIIDFPLFYKWQNKLYWSHLFFLEHDGRLETAKEHWWPSVVQCHILSNKIILTDALNTIFGEQYSFFRLSLLFLP